MPRRSSSHALLAGLCLLWHCQSPLLAQPQRIVSLSLCTDQLTLMLADRQHIASLSYLAANAEFSWLAEEAKGLPLNHGRIEEIMPLQPDLILTSAFSATGATGLLRRLGHEVEALDLPTSLEQVYGQIRRAAALLGKAQRGEDIVRGMQAELEQLKALLRPKTAGARALFYASNGFSYGEDTLRHAFLQTLGIRNLAAEKGLKGVGKLNLETVLTAQPELLLVNSLDFQGEALVQHSLKHPAIAKLPRPHRIIPLHDKHFQCASPLLIEAYKVLLEHLEID